MSGLPLLLLMNGLVFAGAALVARYGLKICTGRALALASALLGWIFIVAGLEALALFDQVRLVPAISLAGVMSALGVCIWWGARGAGAAKCRPSLDQSSRASVQRAGGLVESEAPTRVSSSPR